MLWVATLLSSLMVLLQKLSRKLTVLQEKLLIEQVWKLVTTQLLDQLLLSTGYGTQTADQTGGTEGYNMTDIEVAMSISF